MSTEESYDIIDDFLLAWAFQLWLLPKTTSQVAFEENLMRLCLGYALLKERSLKRHKWGDLNCENAEFAWDEIVEPFFRSKYTDLVNKIENAIDNSHAQYKKQYKENPNKDDPAIKTLDLLNFTGKTFWPQAHETIRTTRQDSSFKDGFISLYVEIGKRAQDNSECAELLELLASCPKGPPNEVIDSSSSPFFDYPILRTELDLFRFLNGIWPEGINRNDPHVCFATVLQLAGIVNLGYVQDYANADLIFVDGYPGYTLHRNQQELGKIRRAMYIDLLNGKMAAQREYLRRIGIQLHRH